MGMGVLSCFEVFQKESLPEKVLRIFNGADMIKMIICWGFLILAVCFDYFKDETLEAIYCTLMAICVMLFIIEEKL